MNLVTVRAIIIEEDKILLVHERKNKEKPPGWGLPGGRVDFSRPLSELKKKLAEFLVCYKISSNLKEAEEKISGIVDFSVFSEKETRIILELMRECLLETGFLVKPLNFLFKEERKHGEILVFLCCVVGGKIEKRTVETDDCDWFEFSSLPTDIFVSHYRMIKKAIDLESIRAFEKRR